MDVDEEDDDIDSPLLNGHENRQRLGILRIFHHKLRKRKLSKSDTKVSWYKTLYHNYCQRSKSISWGLSIGLLFLITGVLCVTYGFMVPGIYKTLGTERNSSDLLQSGARSSLPVPPKEKKQEDRRNMTLYRDIFVILGLVLFAFGGLLLSIFLLWPVYDNEDYEKSPTHSPIYVEYELPNIASEQKINIKNISDTTDEMKQGVTKNDDNLFGHIKIANVQPEEEMLQLANSR